MENDSSDILGHNTMPTLSGNKRSAFPLSLTQALVWSSLFLGIYVLGKRFWKRVLQWRERSYKLATRRRHGIPDSDLRPFNVAYSEAMMRAREEESRKQLKPKPALRPQSFLDQREAQPDQNLRHRQGVPQRPDSGMRSTVIPVPGGYNTGPYEPRLPAQTRNAQDINHPPTDPYNPRHHPVHPATNGFSKPGLVRQGGYLDIADADMSDGEGRKRAFEEEQDEEEHEAKKTRVEGDELIDGDEDAEFEDLAPKRGSKRGLRDEEDGEDVADSSKKARGKRARKVSQEKGPQADLSMDVDDEEADEITELKSTSRGKKRDRAEAGSTFGGDDEDSASELEVDGDAKARRRRKRRTVAKRKSEATYLRAKKLGERDASDSGSDGTSPEKKASRTKRGKRSSHIERRSSKSDVSMDESTTSTRSKIRNIGDEWESNGVKYKIGPNGQRLRQALVKKARQKFVMPKDSQHPDRDANLQVCIETWLTEEEYQDAKTQHLLAWQDTPPPLRNEEIEKLTLNTSTSESVPFPQGVPGKSLLWSTSTSSTPTMSPASQSPAAEAAPPEMARHRSYRDTYRHSIATTVGLPISPFINGSAGQVPTAKRIASNSRAISLTSSISGSPGLSDSTNGSPRTPQHKVFSKWEKQELEARAMMKIREANRKKEMEKEMKAKEERERQERERVAAAERQRAERERMEREREEKERQAAERKAKEAVEKQIAAAAAAATAAPPPQITVTPPSRTGSVATPAAQPTAPTGAVPNFFAPKVEQPSTASSQPQFSFSPGGGGAPAQPTPGSFAFGPTPGAAPTAPNGTGSASASGMKPGGFFAPSAGAEPKKEPSPGGGSSLLSRMGSQAADAPKTQAQGQGQPNPSTAAPTNPMFSFNKPAASAANASAANPFGQPSSSAPAASASTATAAGGEGTTPRFNFGLPSKSTGLSGGAAPVKGPISAFPGATASAGVNGNGTSSLSGALGSDAQKPQSSFNFKTPTTPASGSGAAGASTTPATAPKNFSFGPSAFGNKEQGQKSAFGNTNTNGTSAFGNTNTTSAFGNAGTGSSTFGNTNKASAFGTATTTTPTAFGANTNTTSAFGNNAGSGPAPFGASAAQTSNIFGGAAASKPPADGSAPKQFSFGNPSSSSTSTSSSATVTPGSNNAPKAASTFSFGTPQTPAGGNGNGTSGAAPLSFKFGEAGAGSTTPQSSPFGAAGASAFGGFGAGSGTGTGTSTPSAFGGGVFGAAANANGSGAKQQ